jgi:transposase-like protein
MSGLKGQKWFSEAVKLEVVSGIKEGKYTTEEAMRRYGIGGNSTIYKWQVKYGTVVAHRKKLRSPGMSDPKDDKEAIMTAEEAAAMKKEIRKLFIENTLFRAHVELMEEEHGVEGLKKRIPSAKLEEYERNRIFLKL